MKGLNTFEKSYIICGIFLNVVIAIISKSSWLAIINAIFAVLNAIYMAKGKLITFLFMFIETTSYIILSYELHYYSEVALNLFIHLPMMFVSLYTWFHNQNKETQTIKINTMSKKETIISITSQILLAPIYYVILKSLGNDMLLVSVINLVLTLLALYYNIRMSEYMYICFISSSVFKATLWLAPLLRGEFQNTTVLVSTILYLISDIYGLMSWKKLKKQQSLNHIEKSQS